MNAPKSKSKIGGIKWTLMVLFLFSFFVYFITSAGPTPYDYFTRLAGVMLRGSVLLTENPPWLSELISVGTNTFTFVNPPLPAILAVPFVMFLGRNFEQQILAHILGALSVVLAYKLSFSITNDRKKAIWSTVAFGFGSTFWFLSAVGSVWYLGQVSAVTFTLLAIHEGIKKNQKGYLVGLWVSLACLSRTQLFLAIPFYLYLVWRKNKSIKKLAVFSVFASLGFLVSFFYNRIRFGDPAEFGHALIPGLISEPWFYKGLFNLSYIPNHLNTFLGGWPRLTGEWPYILPTLMGTSVLLTSPWLFLSFKASLKNKIVLPAWITITLIALVNFSYGSTGVSQFGYRYAVDFYPFLFLLVAYALPEKLKWSHWGILIFSILVNTWGVIFINKFGYVV